MPAASSIAAVYGGVGFGPQIKAARRADILVATPGRLEDLIDRGAVSLDAIRILVLDEADRMLDMGFRPAVDRIVGQTPAERQTLFFSATLEGATGKVAAAYTRDARSHTHVEPERAAANIEHRFLAVDSPGRQARPPGRAPARRRGRAARSSSSAPSAAPTGWSSGCAATTSTRSRCTATRASASASGRSPASSAAR